MNPLKIVLLLGVGVTFIFLAAATGGTYWVKTDTINSGLFRACITNVLCRDYDEVVGLKLSDKHRATQAFSVLAVLMSIIAGILALVGMFTEKIPGFVASILLIIAGFCALIAASIFTDENRKDVEDTDGVSFGWSYAFQWVGMILCFAFAGVGFAAK